MRQQIAEETNIKKRTILKQLKPHCKEGLLFMTDPQCAIRPGLPRKGDRYHALQRTKHWKEARLLIRDYNINEEGKLICTECGKEINGSFALHHNLYPKDPYNIFNPQYCSIVHNNKICHKRGDPKKW